MKHPTCNSLAQQLQQISSDFIRFHQVWVFGPATCSSRSGLTCWSQSCPHRSSQLPKWHLERERPIRIPSPYLTTTSMTSALKLQKAMEISVFCIWTIYTVQYIYILYYILYIILYILYYIYIFFLRAWPRNRSETNAPSTLGPAELNSHIRPSRSGCGLAWCHITKGNRRYIGNHIWFIHNIYIYIIYI